MSALRASSSEVCSAAFLSCISSVQLQNNPQESPVQQSSATTGIFVNNRKAAGKYSKAYLNTCYVL